MRAIAFVGATCFEWQVGRLYGRLLRPRFWCRRNASRLVKIGWASSGR